jgi:hypothetical protein
MSSTPNKHTWVWIVFAIMLVAALLSILAVVGIMVIQVMISPAQ